MQGALLGDCLGVAQTSQELKAGRGVPTGGMVQT
jgi:hypothetical protein